MVEVSTLEEARRKRREAAKMCDLSEPQEDDPDLALPIERTEDGMRRIAIINAAESAGWSLSPEQAEHLATELQREAAEARKVNARRAP